MRSSTRRRSRRSRPGCSSRRCVAARRWRAACSRWRGVSSSGTDLRFALVACVLLATRALAQEEPPAPGEGGTVEEHKLTKGPKLKTFVEAEYPPDKRAQNVEAE